LPHQKLIVYQRAVQLLRAVSLCKLGDARLREQALKSAKSVCLNIAEAAGRTSAADQARIFHIALGECCEAAAAVEISAVAGECAVASALLVASLADEVYAMLTALGRRVL